MLALPIRSSFERLDTDMPYYAGYNTTENPAKVNGWFPPIRNYSKPAAPFSWIEITEEQWLASRNGLDSWAVSNGQLVPYTAPAPVLTLTQQAANAAVSGLTITLSGTMTLAAMLFPTDRRTQKAVESMNAMARDGVLPLGSTTYPMIDAAGTWHHFTAAQYQAIAGAIAAYVAACDLIAAGNPMNATALPSSTISLTV